MTLTTPKIPEELQELVKSHDQLHSFGGRTKPTLAAVPEGATPLDMRDLSGIIEYEPDE